MTTTPQPRDLIVPPQHPLAAQPCCLSCGHRDGRTASGGLYCHDCLEDNPTLNRYCHKERQ